MYVSCDTVPTLFKRLLQCRGPNKVWVTNPYTRNDGACSPQGSRWISPQMEQSKPGQMSTGYFRVQLYSLYDQDELWIKDYDQV